MTLTVRNRLAAFGCDMAHGFCIAASMPSKQSRTWAAALGSALEVWCLTSKTDLSCAARCEWPKTLIKTSFIYVTRRQAFPIRKPTAIITSQFPSDFTFLKHHEKHRSVFRARRPWLHRIEHCRRRTGRHSQRANRQFGRRAAGGTQHGQGWLTPCTKRLKRPDRRHAGLDVSAIPHSSRLAVPASRFLPRRAQGCHSGNPSG